MGIFSFVILVTFLSVSLSLFATPLLYHLTQLGILQGTFCTGNNICFLNSYTGSVIIGVIGVLLFFVFLHAFNGLARISGSLAKALLETKK